MRSPCRRWCLCAIVFAFAAAHFLHAQTGSASPKVTIGAGLLEGLPSSAGGAAFLGIPYAAPPVGDLRWESPRPQQPWFGMRRAVQFSPACPQLPAGWLPYPIWSEDCLYLNVWTPKLSPDARLPVIVFFHGGSNRAGYSQLTPLGPALSPLGVVVVTANYRLGALGFFAHPALTAASPHRASGNYGILDQIQALRWVKENIAHFGGDPSRVTAMGQSSGAFDICLMMSSPLAQGLFRQAIMESGDCESTLIADIRTPIHWNGIGDSGESAGEHLAHALGIPDGIADGLETLKKLRALPAKTILETWDHHRELQFDAVVDGWVIPEQPARVFAQGRQAHIPVLVGSNADEATVFGPGPATVSDYWKYLRADTGRWADEEFRTWPASTDAEVPGQYLKLQNATFAYGAWSMARAISRIGEPAYLYLFTWSDTGKRARLGAYHGEELNFLDNSFPSDWVPVTGEKKFGEDLRRYWTNFARDGDPDSPNLSPWPPFNIRSNQVLDLGPRARLAPARSNLRALQELMRPILENGGK
jgi:para-nitrobenzyl esterase